MIIKDKYNLTPNENIFVAKRILIDSIWKSANLEGIAITYPDTEQVFNGLTVNGYKVDEIIAVNNLKRAWFFILDHIDYATDYNFICYLNNIIGGDSLFYKAGYLRTLPVTIGGTTWIPEIPDENEFKKSIAEILTNENKTDASINLMLYIMRSQAFIDGNKRTATLAANHHMIAHGKGIISIPIKSHAEFTKLLIDYYETNNVTKIKEFIGDVGIDGIDFRDRKMSLREPTTHNFEEKTFLTKIHNFDFDHIPNESE